jgi:O-antigen/teichoic acid export membrane protein
VKHLSRNDLVKDGTLVFASTMLSSVFLYAFYFAVSRQLGVERYGTLSALLSAVLLVSVVLASIGTTIIARFAAEFTALAESGKLRRLGDVVTQWCIAIVGIAVVLGVALQTPIVEFLHVDEPALVELSALATGLAIAVNALRGVLQGAQRFRAFSISLLVENFTKTGLGILGVVAGYGILGAMAGYTAGLLLGTLYTYISVRLTFHVAADRLRIDAARLVKTSSGIACGVFGVTTLFYFDVILAKHYLSAEQAGFYGAAMLAGRTLYVVVSFLPTVLLPKATARATSGEPAGRLLIQAIGAALALSGIILAFYYAFPSFVVHVFAGQAYTQAAPLVLPLGAAAAMLGTANIVISYKIGLHRFDFVVPLLVIMTGEIVSIAHFHDSAFAIIRTLLIGHGLVLLCTLYRVTEPVAKPRVETTPVRHGRSDSFIEEG